MDNGEFSKYYYEIEYLINFYQLYLSVGFDCSFYLTLKL